MSIRSIRLLAAAAALAAAGSANAFIVGPATWYSATLELSCPTGPSSHSFSEPSLAACQQYLNQELQEASNNGCEVVELNPCSFHYYHGFHAQDGSSLPAELATDFGNEEHVLRERYRIDEYEAEMGKLIRRLQPAR